MEGVNRSLLRAADQGGYLHAEVRPSCHPKLQPAKIASRLADRKKLSPSASKLHYSSTQDSRTSLVRHVRLLGLGNPKGVGNSNGGKEGGRGVIVMVPERVCRGLILGYHISTCQKSYLLNLYQPMQFYGLFPLKMRAPGREGQGV
jgi:hypothetical protein